MTHRVECVSVFCTVCVLPRHFVFLCHLPCWMCLCIQYHLYTSCHFVFLCHLPCWMCLCIRYRLCTSPSLCISLSLTVLNVSVYSVPSVYFPVTLYFSVTYRVECVCVFSAVCVLPRHFVFLCHLPCWMCLYIQCRLCTSPSLCIFLAAHLPVSQSEENKAFLTNTPSSGHGYTQM